MNQLVGAWRPLVIAVAFLAGAATPARAADPSGAGDDAFDPGKVWKVHLTIPAKEYEVMQPRGDAQGFGAAALVGPPKPEDPARPVHRNTFGVDLPWATGTVTIDGETFKGVGIRYKGNGTIADAARSIKKSFKIDLDRFGGTAQFHGAKSINLHCGAADPSKFRETLGYGLYRAAGVPAPKTTFVELRLTVPGKYDQEFLGMYTAVEEVGKPFLRDRFGDDAGLLMKPEARVETGLMGGLREFEYKGDTWDSYKTQYAPKRDATPDEAKRVIAFAKLVHKADDAEFRREIASYLDVEGYLRFLATTSFIANTDSFFSLGHNYYLYLHPRTRKLHFIPWDVDRAFANLPFFGSADQQMNMSLTRPYPGTHRLTERLLATPEVAERYQVILKELTATCFTKDRLLKQLAAFEEATGDLVARDAKAAKARTDGPAFGRPPSLKSFIDKRTDSVSRQVAGKSKGFVPSGFGPGEFKLGPLLAGAMLDDLDTNKDELLSKDEWAAWAKKVMGACEKDPQGRADEKAVAEALAKLSRRPGDKEPPPGQAAQGPNLFSAGLLVKRADADKDGKVTLDELATATGRLFDEFDKEKTGKLDETALGELIDALFPLPKGPLPGTQPKDGKKDEKKEDRRP